MSKPFSRTFFYSDPHFGHANVIGFCNRPFGDVNAMNEELIRRYNAEIGENDLVYWIGDCFFMNAKDSKAIMDRLNGFKILVLGNHDRGTVGMTQLGFTAVLRRAEIEIGGQVCLMSHYPWEPSILHAIMLMIKKIKIRYVDRAPQRAVLDRRWVIHGHTHSRNKVNYDRKMIHVGVDAWGYAPVPMSAVESLIKKQYRGLTDKHKTRPKEG